MSTEPSDQTLPAEPEPSTPGESALSEPTPTIHEAERESGSSGAILRGGEIEFDQAVARRRAVQDVVVCREDTDLNRRQAYRIEAAVGPPSKPQYPHRRAGRMALPHFHQKNRKPDGHTFYETDKKEDEEEAMKYFTRELIERLNSPDEQVIRAAEVEWEQASERYEARQQEIEPLLPAHIREFNRLLLHDALVLSIGHADPLFVLVLRKDIPPQDLVVMTYTLLEEPHLDPEALPLEQRLQVLDFQYDEFDVEKLDGQQVYSQSIIFGNGWERTLRFRDVQVTLAEPLYPAAGTLLVPTPAGVLTQST